MADWQAIRQEYEQGASLRSLAAKHGISKSLIGKKKFEEQWTNSGHKRIMSIAQAHVDTNPTPVKNTLSTKDKQRLFLEEYAKQANVMVAAKAAGIHRTTVYDWLEKDEAFSFAYNQAKEDAKEVIKAEIFKRGHDGWEENQYYMGMLQGTVHKYSDTLLIFHAKMLMPEYREKQQLDINTNVKAVEIYKIRIPDNGRDA